jgi:hypothetical protein
MYFCVSRDVWVGVATCCGLHGSNTGEGRHFSAPVQTSRVANPASYTMGTGLLSGVKRMGRGVHHLPLLAPNLKIQYSATCIPPPLPSWHVIWWTVTFFIIISVTRDAFITLNCVIYTFTCGPGSSVGIVIGYGLDGPGIESRWGLDFSAPVQTGPGAHSSSYTMGIGSFPGLKSGQGVTLSPHSLLVPWSWKSRAITLLPLWAVRPVQSLSACTRVHFTLQ